MGEWASSNGGVVWQRSGRQETIIARNATLPENAYYEELKLISDTGKEYCDKHDREILQFDSDEASVKSEESDNNESLSSGRVFETLNENTLLWHSAKFDMSVKFYRRYL